MATQQQQKKQYNYGHKYYDRFYFCDSCSSWIPQETAKYVKKKIRTDLVCPKRDCNNNRLKTKSKGYKFKSKSSSGAEEY